MDQAVALGARRLPAVPRLPCSRREEGFIAIHPFSGSRVKNWPLEHYLELADRLEPRFPVRWVLEPGTEPPGGRPALPPTADLFELACRLASAALYIGNDSGITHLAAAAGVPVLALYGPTDPAVWGPRGANQVAVLRSEAADRSMSSLSVEAVHAAAERLLALTARG
jgi:ADP-heptose:LPS heptosyltransferase